MKKLVLSLLALSLVLCACNQHHVDSHHDEVVDETHHEDPHHE